ncbi:MAG: nucleotidyltransferase family protein [Magnetococcales bacterium]|nr:nucleotidyltransferase family protein [Magnetococcales bacterium]
MNAMILAAGRGERLRPLTDQIPKPMVRVQGRPVIVHTLLRLAHLGITRIVINACHLADKLIEYVGDGSPWGVQVTWSREACCLDTGGGVVNALHHMGDAPFLVVNGDILWNCDLRPMLAYFDPARMDGVLGMVASPAGEGGDFLCDPSSGQLQRAKADPNSLTYAGILVVAPAALRHYPLAPFSLNRFFDDALLAGRLRGFPLRGQWADMGTPERLAKTAQMDWISDDLCVYNTAGGG